MPEVGRKVEKLPVDGPHVQDHVRVRICLRKRAHVVSARGAWRVATHPVAVSTSIISTSADRDILVALLDNAQVGSVARI